MQPRIGLDTKATVAININNRWFKKIRTVVISYTTLRIEVCRRKKEEQDLDTHNWESLSKPGVGCEL